MNATPTTYQNKANATRSRRQAKGMYKRPTVTQVAAFKVYIREGAKALTQAQMLTLATHPWLAPSQRIEFESLAASVNW